MATTVSITSTYAGEFSEVFSAALKFSYIRQW